MTALPGDRPERSRNFHGPKGEHLHPHPETYEPRTASWSAWERRYARHLDEHRRQAEDPTPLPSDSQLVLDLFAHIENLTKVIKKEKQLIVALRQRQAAYPEADALDLGGLHRLIKEGGGDGPHRVPQQ